MTINFKNQTTDVAGKGKEYKSLFDSVLDIIAEDLKVKGKILKDYTKGTSFGIKRSVAFGKDILFVKIGEKVAKENEIYDNRFYKDNKIFLNRIEKYCICPDVLVVPFFKGQNLDEFLFNKGISLNDKIEKIEKILDTALDRFWLQNIKKGDDNLSWMEEYLVSRINRLADDIESIDLGSQNIKIDAFLDMPVSYLNGDKRYELPSIREMVKNILVLFKKFRPQFTSCATVDFQPPNIIINNGEFKHIDLSNSEIDSDMAIDIGKFFNFINRFYRVSFLRDHIKLGGAINPKCTVFKNSLSFKVNDRNQNTINKVAPYLEEKFALKVSALTGDFHLIDRIKLYKFVINAITIRRHLDYSGLQDLLFANLFDSYAEISDKIICI